MLNCMAGCIAAERTARTRRLSDGAFRRFHAWRPFVSTTCAALWTTLVVAPCNDRECDLLKDEVDDVTHICRLTRRKL
jgi:hypothetical protein